MEHVSLVEITRTSQESSEFNSVNTQAGEDLNVKDSIALVASNLLMHLALPTLIAESFVTTTKFRTNLETARHVEITRFQIHLSLNVSHQRAVTGSR